MDDRVLLSLVEGGDAPHVFGWGAAMCWGQPCAISELSRALLVAFLVQCRSRPLSLSPLCPCLCVISSCACWKRVEQML